MITIEERGFRRLLFPSGVTVVDEWDKAREILSGNTTDSKCFVGYETDRYKEIYLKDIAISVEDLEDPVYDEHLHTEEDLSKLLNLISTSDRFISDEHYTQRIDDEMRFFIMSKNVNFLLRVYTLVKRLKEETVVGVGRGSACASLVMYLLGIHDIDPVKYKINFRELSKGVGDEQ